MAQQKDHHALNGITVSQRTNLCLISSAMFVRAVLPIPASIQLTAHNLVDATITLLVKLGIVLIFAPAFIVPAIVITILGAFLGNVYTKAQLSMKREAGNAKAPVLATFGGAMAGLSEWVSHPDGTREADTLHFSFRQGI